jgi:hypothetical protein
MNPTAQTVLIAAGVDRPSPTGDGRPNVPIASTRSLIAVTIGVGPEMSHHANVVSPLNAPGRMPAQNILAHRTNFRIYNQLSTRNSSRKSRRPRRTCIENSSSHLLHRSQKNMFARRQVITPQQTITFPTLRFVLYVHLFLAGPRRSLTVIRMNLIRLRTPREIGVYLQMDPRQKLSGILGGQPTQLFDRLPPLLAPYLILYRTAHPRQSHLAKNEPGQSMTTLNSTVSSLKCLLHVAVGDVGSIAL